MFSEQIGLPDGTWKVAFIISLAGLVIAVIVSWVYDIHPVGGLVKTEPAQKVKEEDKPSTSSSWKIASYISFVVIVGLIVLNIIPRAYNNRKVLDKSIAVLPFINESPELNNDYLIKSYRTAVHDNLCRIKELRVRSLESTERYIEQTKSKPEIAKELGVGYLLSARGQILNNKIRLTVQLADANDVIIWSSPYNRQTELVEDHIDIQSDIAELVARKLETTITPEVKQRNATIPTTSQNAYNYYQKGREMLSRYESVGGDNDFLNEAERLFNLALEHDPTYSMAYVGVGEVFYWNTLRYLDLWDKDSAQISSDTIIELTDLALKYDPQNSEAFNLRGNYYYRVNVNNRKALEEYEKALDYNPNDHIAQHYVGLLSDDLLKALKSTHASLLRDNSEFIKESLEKLVEIYSIAGFPEKAKYYATELLSINLDSAWYYFSLSWIAFLYWNIDESYSYAEKAMQIDSANYSMVYFALLHRTGNYKRLYVDFLKPYESDFYSGDLKDLHPYLNETFAIHLGMHYWYKGDIAKAKNLLQIEIERINQDFIGHDFLGTGVRDALQHWIELFSVTGDIDYAFHLFRQFQDITSNFDVYWEGYYISFKMSPRFANISQESWFQDAIYEWESELETEHERVRQWLEENDML